MRIKKFFRRLFHRCRDHAILIDPGEVMCSVCRTTYWGPWGLEDAAESDSDRRDDRDGARV